jgi:hypothetical protein
METLNINNSRNIVIDVETYSSNYEENHKVPFLYETWNWEGDESCLPYKWLELIKQSDLINKNSIESISVFIKENYYKNTNFDKKSFFFITHRSDVAGCVYLNKKNINSIEEDGKNLTYSIEFLLANKKKHDEKGIEEALLNLAIKRAKFLSNKNGDKLKNITLDLSSSNIGIDKIRSMIN